MRDFRLPPRSRWELCSSVLLRGDSGNYLRTFRVFAFLTLEEGAPIGCPETSIRNYHYSLRNNPEERSSRKNVIITIVMVKVNT
jgi:hypothetical protein